jgi:hypothetical protein
MGLLLLLLLLLLLRTLLVGVKPCAAAVASPIRFRSRATRVAFRMLESKLSCSWQKSSNVSWKIFSTPCLASSSFGTRVDARRAFSSSVP